MSLTAFEPLLKIFHGIMGVFYVRFGIFLFCVIVVLCALYSLYGSLREYVKFIVYVMLFVIGTVLLVLVILDSNLIKTSFESDSPTAKYALETLRNFFIGIRNLETLAYEKSSVQDVVPRWVFEK